MKPTDESVRVLFFGSVAQRMGARERAVCVPEEGLTLEQLKLTLAGDETSLLAALGPPTRAAVDQAIVGEDARVRPGQEIAFLPVFSGG